MDLFVESEPAIAEMCRANNRRQPFAGPRSAHVSNSNQIAVNLPVRDGITLTEFRPTDIDGCVRHLNDEAIYRVTLRIPFPYGRNHAQDWLAIVDRKTRDAGRTVDFAIRGADGELIGGIGFDAVKLSHKAEIGYWLGRPFWGQGLMTDIVRVATRFGIESLGLVRIEAIIFQGNDASCRVAEKNGYVLEGTMRKSTRKDGRFIDTLLYAHVTETGSDD